MGKSVQRPVWFFYDNATEQCECYDIYTAWSLSYVHDIRKTIKRIFSLATAFALTAFYFIVLNIFQFNLTSAPNYGKLNSLQPSSTQLILLTMVVLIQKIKI